MLISHPPYNIVLPRVVYDTKGTRRLRSLIRRQQARFRDKDERRMIRQMGRMMQKRSRSGSFSNRMHRAARPRVGTLKDRDNSDPSEGEDEGFLEPRVEILSDDSEPVIPLPPPAINSSVRSCRRAARSSLADVEHSAGSDDEDHLLPNFRRRHPLSERDVVRLLLSLASK
jgi:hypothetical protein